MLTDTNMLRPCTGITRLTVSTGAGIKAAAETLRAYLLIFFVELRCWYGGAFVTFKISGAGVWKTLVETLTKTDLRTLRETLTEHLVLIFTLLTIHKGDLFF